MKQASTTLDVAVNITRIDFHVPCPRCGKRWTAPTALHAVGMALSCAGGHEMEDGRPKPVAEYAKVRQLTKDEMPHNGSQGAKCWCGEVHYPESEAEPT